MSAAALPITSQRFAAALSTLPISSLHAKIAELQNAIAHLHRSNKELEDFAREGDKDCYEALLENRDVIGKFEERVRLVEREIVEVRGLPLRPKEEGEVQRANGTMGENGTGDVDMAEAENERLVQNGVSGNGSGHGPAGGAQQNGTSRPEHGDGDGEEGVFL